MITVKLFGLLRLNSGIREMTLDATTVLDIRAALMCQSDQITKRDFDGCVILINGRPGNKRSKLVDGDQVVLMSPVAGG